MLAALDDVAAPHGATPAQVALAWLMRYPGVVSPIASATGTAQVAEIMAAVDLVITDEEFARLDAAGR
jgi:aryl-alcohol dehydrogenase-like predicted oxidoreductase